MLRKTALTALLLLHAEPGSAVDHSGFTFGLNLSGGTATGRAASQYRSVHLGSSQLEFGGVHAGSGFVGRGYVGGAALGGRDREAFVGPAAGGKFGYRYKRATLFTELGFMSLEQEGEGTGGDADEDAEVLGAPPSFTAYKTGVTLELALIDRPSFSLDLLGGLDVLHLPAAAQFGRQMFSQRLGLGMTFYPSAWHSSTNSSGVVYHGCCWALDGTYHLARGLVQVAPHVGLALSRGLFAVIRGLR